MSKQSKKESFERQIRIAIDLIGSYNQTIAQAKEKGDNEKVKACKNSIEHERNAIKMYEDELKYL